MSFSAPENPQSRVSSNGINLSFAFNVSVRRQSKDDKMLHTFRTLLSRSEVSLLLAVTTVMCHTRDLYRQETKWENVFNFHRAKI